MTTDGAAKPAIDGAEPLDADLADERADGAPARETRHSTVGAAQHGWRLDKAVVSMAGEFSRNHLQSLIEDGHVLLDGARADSAAKKVRAGQRLDLTLVETAESRAFQPEAIAIDVVYEDEHLLVVNKAAGMVTHPAAGHWSGTLLNALLGRHRASASLPRAGIVHRLDKDTSGLMVVGRTLAAVTTLSQAISRHDVQREYLAIVHGSLGNAIDRIEAPIGRDPRSRIRMAVVGGGKPARTDIACLAEGGGFSALRCTLHTGRTHQIRVHLATHRHPLVGDALYGGAPALGMTRQALHAARLAFLHPASREPMQFDAEPPVDFGAAWRQVLEAVGD